MQWIEFGRFFELAFRFVGITEGSQCQCQLKVQRRFARIEFDRLAKVRHRLVVARLPDRGQTQQVVDAGGRLSRFFGRPPSSVIAASG